MLANEMTAGSEPLRISQRAWPNGQSICTLAWRLDAAHYASRISRPAGQPVPPVPPGTIFPEPSSWGHVWGARLDACQGHQHETRRNHETHHSSHHCPVPDRRDRGIRAAGQCRQGRSRARAVRVSASRPGDHRTGYGHSGLGLSLVRGFCELLGWSIAHRWRRHPGTSPGPKSQPISRFASTSTGGSRTLDRRASPVADSLGATPPRGAHRRLDAAASARLSSTALRCRCPAARC